MSRSKTHNPESIRPHQSFRPETQMMSADLDKQYIIRALSHDINAQLMVLEYSHRICETLAKDAQNHRWDEAHDHVTACIDGLKRFVGDLVSFAGTGEIDMEPREISMAEVVEEVLYEQRHLLERRSIDVVVSPTLPRVHVNHLRMKQILSNLIRNAAIHGCDAMTPMIVITATSHVSNVVLKISDNGTGIPKSVQEKIFDPGYRAPSSHVDGSGVGLAIVRKIARYYGGEAEVVSDHITGTTFQITLPGVSTASDVPTTSGVSIAPDVSTAEPWSAPFPGVGSRRRMESQPGTVPRD